MAAKRDRAAAPAAVSSPRRTRSATSGKRASAPLLKAAPPAKKAKPASAAKGKGKNKVAFAAGKVKNEVAAAVEGAGKTIIIEACKQCTSFKKRAEAVKDGLESAVVGIIVVINPEKPRRGCFEIRESNGEVFISLLGMPRPFTPMKKLDMDQVVADIVKKVA